MPPKQKMCFVIMPFSKERKEVYTYGIKPACEKAGFKPVRVDELPGFYNINRKIIEHLCESEVIVADLTDRNANVFYEMGVAHAIANKTIMIVQETGDLPFDIRNYRCIVYKQSVEGLKELETDVVECLQTLDDWRQRPSNPVQDFKPHAGVVSSEELNRLRKALQEKEALLKTSVPKRELQTLQGQLRREKERVDQIAGERSKLRATREALQKEIQSLRSQLQTENSAAELAELMERGPFAQNP